MPFVTLLSDFGLRDPFVGEVRGVLASLSPEVRVADITHGIARGNVREGAWVLMKAWHRFPPGTCHLAVVDPGVGGDRLAVCAVAGGHTFVGPDNGLLAPALASAGSAQIREIQVRAIDGGRLGTTFDGRDLFAPVAAWLARGEPFEQVGPEVDDLVPVAPFEPIASGEDTWEVEVVRSDRFGNLVTVAEEAFLREQFGEDWRGIRVRIGDHRVESVGVAYDDVQPGEPLLSIGGSGTLEISVRDGSARDRYSVEPGERVVLEAPSS